MIRNNGCGFSIIAWEALAYRQVCFSSPGPKWMATLWEVTRLKNYKFSFLIDGRPFRRQCYLYLCCFKLGEFNNMGLFYHRQCLLIFWKCIAGCWVYWEQKMRRQFCFHPTASSSCGSKQDGEATPPSVFTNQLDPPKLPRSHCASKFLKSGIVYNIYCLE